MGRGASGCGGDGGGGTGGLGWQHCPAPAFFAANNRQVVGRVARGTRRARTLPARCTPLKPTSCTMASAQSSPNVCGTISSKWGGWSLQPHSTENLARLDAHFQTLCGARRKVSNCTRCAPPHRMRRHFHVIFPSRHVPFHPTNAHRIVDSLTKDRRWCRRSLR